MECLSSHKINCYVEGSLSNVEASMIRDHLLHCDRCRRLHEQISEIENNLSRPVMHPVPESLGKTVMQRLFPATPSIGAVAALVFASFLLLVSWIYIYFDFAHNSLVQAMQMTSNRLFRFAGAVIQGISAVFSAVYAAFRAISKFLSVFLDLQIDGKLVLLSVIILTLIPVFLLYRFLHQRHHNQSSL